VLKNLLFLASHDEVVRTNRRFARAIELFMDVDEKREKNSQIPVFILKNRRFLGSHDEVVRTSDNWDAFKDGLVYVYGKLEIPSYKGIGRRPDPVIVPSDDLKYA